jgi:2-oxoglutarate ferredoxin oxidoreductase subunit alpha
MAATASSGPGIALKSEAMGLAVMLELPMIIINIQRGGPSTGLPTKTEQADLLQVMFGRNGEAPMPVLACRSPADCFDTVREAWRIAVRYMMPVTVLSDGYVANGSEPWRIPRTEDLDKIPVTHPGPGVEGEEFFPYERDEWLARPWAIPGTPGLMHRIGGLEKEDLTGNVSYDPDNHQNMIQLRAAKVEKVAEDIPLQGVNGPDTGDLLVLSWGGTYGACVTAVRQCQSEGLAVAHSHLRYLNPLPNNLRDVLLGYRSVLIPELNMGQLRMLIRAKYLVDAHGLNKMKGKPFAVQEIVSKIKELLS